MNKYIIAATIVAILNGCAVEPVYQSQRPAPASAQEVQRVKAQVEQMTLADREETRPGETLSQQLDRLRREAARSVDQTRSIQEIFNDVEGLYGELYQAGQLCYASMERESSDLMFCRRYLRVQAKFVGINDVLGPMMEKARKVDPSASVVSNGNFEKASGVMTVVADAMKQRAAKL